MSAIQKSVKDYYGKVLKSKEDLQTSACCIADKMPDDLRALLGNIHDDIRARFYGCGTPIPPQITGTTILDLGCGTGQDVYMLSQIVGENGKVIGIDMTDEQLNLAKTHINWHMEKFGYTKPNVEFKKGYIENLKEAGIEDQTIDIIISNCVINLSPDKHAVFNEAFRVLKPGGEIYFSDVFASKPIDPELMNDPILLGECLSGAIHKDSFDTFTKDIGFENVEMVKSSPLEIESKEIAEKLAGIDFESITYRVFKPAGCCGTSRKDTQAKSSCC